MLRRVFLMLRKQVVGTRECVCVCVCVCLCVYVCVCMHVFRGWFWKIRKSTQRRKNAKHLSRKRKGLLSYGNKTSDVKDLCAALH